MKFRPIYNVNQCKALKSLLYWIVKMILKCITSKYWIMRLLALITRKLSLSGKSKSLLSR